MILFRYVVRQFVATFAFTLLALCLLFVIIDLFERLDKFIDRGVTAVQLIQYYIVYLPFIAKVIIPVATLLASLFSVGRLTTHNEIVAMRAAGQSQAQFLAPYLMIALLISVGQVYFNGWVVPAATSIRLDMERKVMQESAGGSLFNLYFRDQPTRNVIIEYYDKDQRAARNVAIEEFGSVTQPRLQWRIDAPSMRWDSARSGWVADSAIRRSFHADAVMIDRLQKVDLPFTVRHDQIVRLQRDQDELLFTEIPEYIETLKAGGKDTQRQEIAYYAGWAFPFSNLVVVLIAVPFASVRRRGGIAVNISAAMALTFAYIAFTEINQAVGASMQLSPILVGWSANALFTFMALVNLLIQRK